MTDAAPGLRERKRRATRLAIQQAALRIAIEHGLSAVTVDEVSRRADVSPRTFFNYFPSKEQAILGDDPTLPQGQDLEAFVAGGPSGELLADLGTLLVHSAHELIDERGLIGERQQVLRANPELFSQRMASMKEFQAGIQSVVEQRLRREDGMPPASGAPTTPADDEVRRRARLASLVGMAALRHAWWEWSESDADAHLVDELERSFADLGALVSRSLV
ncbi:TetR/AcrR family transcriptional regulator [Curtobacterium herbarum]|uniref:TetR family transcriptional regulator n=1 Tax=Curtobacterium herbarum TaxID=150122 RepID=A0ABN1ZGQ9_9MICO|nr:TetR/AcrR family transcriptional regulator [Curtobacterium herbarum]MBM7474923.1 AcrR family transcriptional regulator [Curtobacterium herbarum]MCS6545568.1 TetR/AcrR family transcriptional regulator [Curtobacterium herbarum]